MKTTGVSCETKFGLLGFLGHPNDDGAFDDDVVNDDCVDDIDDDDGRAIKSFKYTSWHGPGRLFFIKEMKDSLGESAN